MYRVCRLTGAAGADASALYRDPELLGHVYCGPYPTADPGLTWVVTDDEGVAGYVVGTADTAGFAAWQESSWWPALRERYPLPDGTGPGPGAGPDSAAPGRRPGERGGEPGPRTGTGPGVPSSVEAAPFPPAVVDRPRTRDHELVRLLHAPPSADPAVVDRYPAHLHIDLLPRTQGRGLGRALIGRLTDALRERGVPGLHLGVDPANTGARAFYARLGLTPAPTPDGSLVLALAL
jgi:hypothetical protein